VNLEYLAQTVWTREEREGGRTVTYAFPDTLVGTDSHTTMVNGLSVLGWGVGGIEAEAAMLGQPISMLIPEVIGFRMTGRLTEGTTATDLVLTVTEMLRKKGVVGKFVEFYGPGLASMTVEDRATIGNMAPEYGATCGLFPIEDDTIKYLKATGRDPARVALVEAYAKAQGMWRSDAMPDPTFTDTLELDLGTVVPSLAGPKRPQDRVALANAAREFERALSEIRGGEPKTAAVEGANYEIADGHVVIAAITSCTNTSNPSVLIGAGLLAKKAHEKGLKPKPWVKTSLAPGSQVVTDYLARAGLQKHLDALGFNLVGYGCTTLRQSQFRGTREPRRAGELSRFPASRRRLCACRVAARRHHARADRRRSRRKARLPEGSVADIRGDRRTHAGGDLGRNVPGPLRRRFQGG
jgi:aconitate hydratase